MIYVARMARPRLTVVAIGLAASALFLFFAVRGLDVAALRDAWHNADLLPWLPLAIASYLAGHVMRGVRCRRLVRREASLSLLTASNVIVVGYASNNVLPARMGELVRAGMFAERTGIPLAQSLAVTFIERVLDGLAIVFLLVVAMIAGGADGWMLDIVGVGVAVFGVATAVLLTAAHAPSLVVGVVSRLANRLGPAWHDRFVSLATSLTGAAAYLRDPRDVLVLFAQSAVVWTLEAGLFIALLPTFGLELSVTVGVIAMGVTNLGLLAPSSPGFIGPFHFFCSRAVMAYGVAEATAVAYATLVHLAFYVPATIWGASAMLWYGVELGTTAAAAREARRSNRKASARGVPYVEIARLAPPPPEPPASAMTRGLVEALVVGDDRVPDPAAVEHAATFVEGQLRALPARLRLLFGCGMAAFRFTTRLRFLRGYCDVPLARRRRWTRRWADGRIALFRQLFKPVRATAVLAYYDAPTVRRELLGADLVPAAALVAARAESP